VTPLSQLYGVPERFILKVFRKLVMYKLALVLEYVGWAILLGIVALMTTGTIARYVLHRPLLFQVEVVSAMMVAFCSFGFAVVFLQGGHIRVNLVTRHLPKPAQDCLWLFAELLTIMLAILIIVTIVDLVSLAVELNIRTLVFRIPEAPILICLQVGFGLFGLVVLADFCKRFYKLLKAQRS